MSYGRKRKKGRLHNFNCDKYLEQNTENGPQKKFCSVMKIERLSSELWLHFVRGFGEFS